MDNDGCWIELLATKPSTSKVNDVNQYTQRTNAGYLDIQGLALATNAVTVNGSKAYRKGEYFRKELSVANSSASVWQSVTNAASGETTVTGNIFVPKTPELYTYDADGNLTSDGHWTNRWDAENRLTRAESLSTTPLASRRKVEWQYDGQGRRIRQTTYDGSSGSYVATEDLIFLSDPASAGRHIAELNATNNALVRSYVWGLDLSGTMDGAGGVGGLLMISSVANGTHFYAYDGNGNVTGLVKGSDGTVSANYNYDPFGKVLRTTGAMADENRFQFSTKRCDRTTDFNLYEYRVLGDGRWLNRDPLGEPGFEVLRGKRTSTSAGEPNRYLFVKNNPLQNIDPDGLDLITITYANGTTVTYGTFSSPNLGQLMGALTNAAGTISGITIKGHACCTIQSFGDDLLTMNSTGTQILATDGTDISGALKSALAPGAWIYLAGCGSGRGAGNIAQQMSAVLPGVTVSGHQGVAALNVPFCGCAIGKRNYYINGTLQHSAW